MKRIFIILLLVLSIVLCSCGEIPYANTTEYPQEAETEYHPLYSDAIPFYDAAKHDGEFVTVYGTVEEVSQPGVSGDPIFIDIGAAYPDESRVTAVIWEESHSAFPDANDYYGKTIYVSGTIYMYNGVPNIELTDQSQIEIDE